MNAHPRPIQPLAFKSINGKTTFIRQPFFIHIIINAGDNPHDFPTTCLNLNVGAQSIHDINTIGLFIFPRPGMKSRRLSC